MNVLVTGGTRGIGAGIVRALAGAGHSVGFCGRNEAAEHQKDVDALQKEFSGRFKYYRCDVSSQSECSMLVESFVSDFGSLDALVNNAGVAPLVRADLLDMSAESFERVMKINLEGPFFLTQLAAKAMIAKNSTPFRCIINISSISADYASVNRGEYCLSKAAVAMATRLWAARLADDGIAVYEIRPGIIKSDMTSGVTEKYDKLIAGGITLQKRWGFPDDIGKAVRMLVSGDLAYSTGQVINVDGGFTVMRF